MQRWLMKTEPGTFSIDDLAARRTEPWDGVRNYQARNFIRAMHRGDAVLIYHSACAQPGVGGRAEVGTPPPPAPPPGAPPPRPNHPPTTRAGPPAATTTTPQASARIRAGHWLTYASCAGCGG